MRSASNARLNYKIEMLIMLKIISNFAFTAQIILFGMLPSTAFPRIAPIKETICDLTLWSPGISQFAPLRKDGKFSFKCSIRDRGFGDGNVIITNLNTLETYVSGEDGGWAAGRRCIYREGSAYICTRTEWKLIN